ncbi:unnamed protein product [Staurois parvus]|uniref:Uncharacterized protein n=1 Tax=Staurois parvus TaxID=386267 RepID=A0ABN9E2S8_9NEOB|nr:unnamed protein product [Staurois parvus]
MIPYCPGPHELSVPPLVAHHWLFWVLFEFGQGHRGPMIPYCSGAP